MKIDDIVLKFPKKLPNDEQDFMIYYPYKFPKVIKYFENLANHYYDKPLEYEEFVKGQFKELEEGFNKINTDYQAGNQDDLTFLIAIDQRFNKLFCFKFWVINYVFADGPLHEYYVDKLKAYARKMVDTIDDVEDYEQRVIRIQRDLLQTEYADLYLIQALGGVKLLRSLTDDPLAQDVLNKVIPLINNDRSEANDKAILDAWKPIADLLLQENNEKYKEARSHLGIPLNQVIMRKSELPLYNFLNHTVEFRTENEKLFERYEQMQRIIDEYFQEAKEKFSQEEYDDFKLAYEMARIYSMSKDIMGEIDTVLIPAWVQKLHKQLYTILSRNQEVNFPSIGHSAVFHTFVWYLPDDLKARVMSIDDTAYNLEDL